MELQQDEGGETKTRCWKGWPRVRAADFMKLPHETADVKMLEDFKNENPHVFQARRDHPFEGMSNPAAQVVMRCNVDVKYLGRCFADEDLARFCQGKVDAPEATVHDGDARSAADVSERAGVAVVAAASGAQSAAASSSATQAAELEQSVAKKHRHGTAALKPKTRGDGSMRGALERMLIDMFRDMQDVGFYVGEYAAKKFEISRSLLPELFAGVQRLEEEERERRREHASTLLAEDSADVPEERGRASTVQEQRQRCLSILRRLAFGMNRCICKSNGEMAYQLLYQQEQYVSFAGYNMFFRFVPYAIMRCREVALKAASLRAPHMQVDPLDAPEEPDSGPMPVRELAELSESDEEGGQSKASARLRVVQFNQKDDYLHRGRNPLLRCMSMVMYSRFVRRVDRSKAGKPDGVRFFEFEKHYPHFESSLQDPRRVFSLTVLSSCFCLFYSSSFLLLLRCRLHARPGGQKRGQHRSGASGSSLAAGVRIREVRSLHAGPVISFPFMFARVRKLGVVLLVPQLAHR